VLCVEDNPSSLKLLESIIERISGATMISAHTGELGVDMAEIHRPNVILMDINLIGMIGMIGMTGIEALERLKASPATTDIPVIALTAWASAKDKTLGLEAGFAEYLTKPIDVEKVTFAIHQACRSA
jgi:CheY-like chemotaxis protein